MELLRLRRAEKPVHNTAHPESLARSHHADPFPAFAHPSHYNQTPSQTPSHTTNAPLIQPILPTPSTPPRRRCRPSKSIKRLPHLLRDTTLSLSLHATDVAVEEVEGKSLIPAPPAPAPAPALPTNSPRRVREAGGTAPRLCHNPRIRICRDGRRDGAVHAASHTGSGRRGSGRSGRRRRRRRGRAGEGIRIW